MADATLGTYWFQLSPSTKGISSAISKELGNVDIPGMSRSWGSTITSTLGDAFKTVTKVGVGAVATVGTVVAGLALKGGISRALAIEDAQAKLKGLGHDSKSVASIMDSALASVKGTAYGLGDAATVAASLSASGIKSGDELTNVLKTVADTAQISGRSLTDVGAIFGSVAARGKLQGDDMLQLMSAGVPVLQFLSKQLGVTTADVSTMVSKGQIDFATFASAMQAGLGGAAQAGGETFRGALANVQAALSRLGASAAAPVLNALRDTFNSMIPVLDGVTSALAPLMETLGKKVGDTAALAATALAKVGDSLSGFKLDDLAGFSDILKGLAPIIGGVVGSMGPFLKDIPIIGKLFGGLTGPVGLAIGIFTSLMTLSEPFRLSILHLAEALGSGLGEMLPGASAALGAFQYVLAQVGNILGPIIDLFAVGLYSAVTDLTPTLLNLVGTLGGVAMTAFQAIVPVVSSLASALTTGLVATLRVLGPLLTGVTGFLRDHQGVVLAVAGAWAAWKVGGILVGIAKSTGSLVRNTAAWVANKVALLQSKAETVALAAMYGREFVVNLVKSTAAVVAQSAAWVAQKAVMLAGAAASGVATAAQWALNAAMNANPIGLVVAAVAALVAGLVLFFTKTETGRKIWANLTAAFQSFISWIGPGWSAVMNGIGEVWSKVWDGIVTAAKVAVTVITTAVLLPFQIAWNVWSAIFGWAYTNAIKPALDAIGAGFSWLWVNAIKPVLDNIALGWQVLSALASVVWGAISGAVSSAWSAITGVVESATAAVMGWVSERFEAVKAGATIVWNAISTTISTVWATIKGIVLGAAQAVYDYVNAKFTAVKVGAQIIWDTIKTSISNVWTGIKSIAQLGAQWVHDKVMGPFNNLKSGGIKVFEALRDGIGKAWNGLKAVAAKPVNFIIDTVYTNGIKHLAETVASKVGLKLTLPTIKGITGYATGGVLPGYTPGRDSVLAHLSPGEGILVPEAVRGLGPGFVGWANRTFSNGRSSGGVGTGGFGLPAFADGGIVGWFKDKAKGVADFFSDPLGAVANLITKPVKALMDGVGSGLFADLGKGAIDQILGAIPGFFKKQVDKLGGSSSKLVNAAMRAVQMGVPYVWGGSSVPPGLDCSGLVYWAAQQLGLGWPRLTAAGYQAASVAKSMSNVVPGDLLFWGNPAYHVAIAAGAGKMVEEPKPGMSARYTNIWGNPSVGSYVGRNSKVAAPEYLKYDNGGYLQPGLTLAYNATGKPEPVFTHEQAQGVGVGMTDAQMRRFAEFVADAVERGADRGVSGRIGSSSRQNVRAVMGV